MVIAGREIRDQIRAIGADRRAIAAAERRAIAEGKLEEPGSPLWWRHRLLTRMHVRDPGLAIAEDYYSGDHRLAFQTAPFKKAFGKLFARFSDNWCELVVDAVEERLNVEGFRIGTSTQADEDAWLSWQRNAMDAESGINHLEALIAGECSVLVWGDADGEPVITIEHARQMIVETEPGNRYRRKAALKRWQEPDGHGRVTLYLPDALYKWTTADTIDAIGGVWPDVSEIRWEPLEVAGEPWPLPNRLGTVPVVPFPNKPRAIRSGRSEIANVIPLQDGTNKLMADLLVASEFAAFRQRWATGIEIPTDPETDQPIEPFKAAIDRLWIVGPQDPDAPEPRFGEFSETRLEGYVAAIELLVQHVASQTRTPPHYFYLGGGQPPSGEAIKSAETGLVAKSRRRMRAFGEAWEEVIRLTFAVQSDARADEPQIETVWGDPESRSEAEHTDSILKQSTLGIPQEILWAELGFSPQEIDRMKRMRLEESIITAGLGELGMPASTPVLPSVTPPPAEPAPIPPPPPA